MVKSAGEWLHRQPPAPLASITVRLWISGSDTRSSWDALTTRTDEGRLLTETGRAAEASAPTLPRRLYDPAQDRFVVPTGSHQLLSCRVTRNWSNLIWSKIQRRASVSTNSLDQRFTDTQESTRLKKPSVQAPKIKALKCRKSVRNNVSWT